MAAQDEFGQRPPVTSLAGYFDRWSQLHGDLDPRSSWLIRNWLTIAYRIAKPVTRTGLSPNGVTVVGVAVAGCVPLLVWLGMHHGSASWIWLAVVVAAISGMLDNLDGAVAVITGRTTRGGYVLDSVADRISDALLLCALWLAGAPGLLVSLTLLVGFLQEYSRARAVGAGVSEVGVVSISERPTRVAIVAVFLGLAAWAPYGIATSSWAAIGAAAAFVVAAIGLVQVWVALGSRLH